MTKLRGALGQGLIGLLEMGTIIYVALASTDQVGKIPNVEYYTTELNHQN